MIALLLACAGTPESDPAVAPNAASAATPAPPAAPAQDALPMDLGIPLAPIVLDEPGEGTTHARKLHLRGSAHAWEGLVNAEITAPGMEPLLLTIQTGQSAPDRATFNMPVELPEGTTGTVTITLFTSSAKDGSRENVVTRTITVE